MSHDEFHPAVRIGRRPFYPWLTAFAASCMVGALATDIAYWATANVIWTDFSDWLLIAGVIVGLLSIVVALIEALARRAPRRRPAWPFWLGGIVALVLGFFDMLVHTRDAWTSVVPWGLTLSAATVLVLIVAAFMARAAAGPAVTEVTA
jgi:uncharacterized membrane protein